MKIEIQNLLEDFNHFHSRFQIENFILWGSGNDWAKYKQALREIQSRRQSIFDLTERIALAGIEFKGHRIRRAFQRLFNHQKYDILRRKAERELISMRETLEDLKREMKIFVKFALKLKRLKFSKLTENQKRDLEAQSWLEIARVMSIIDLMSTGVLSQGSMEMILKMPRSYRTDLLNSIDMKNRKNLIEWVLK